MKRAHSVYISMMIILRITVCSWSISLRRLKNRYDEIKERDEAIKTDYFKIIMKGLRMAGQRKRNKEKQDMGQSGVSDPWKQQRWSR